MAYMHELMHICHPCCPFFGNLTYANGYHSIFIWGAVTKPQVNWIEWFFAIEKCPEIEKIDDKIFFEKYFLCNEKFIANIFYDQILCWEWNLV